MQNSVIQIVAASRSVDQSEINAMLYPEAHAGALEAVVRDVCASVDWMPADKLQVWPEGTHLDVVGWRILTVPGLLDLFKERLATNHAIAGAGLSNKLCLPTGRLG